MSGEIIIDSSALMAILLGEPDADSLAQVIASSPHRRVSALNHLESSVVIAARKGQAGLTALDTLLQGLDVEIVPFTREHAGLAREAYLRFGKGRHPAGLNLGDCCAYALAKALDLPLLFKGNDFSQTDIIVARVLAEQIQRAPLPPKDAET